MARSQRSLPRASAAGAETRAALAAAHARAAEKAAVADRLHKLCRFVDVTLRRDYFSKCVLAADFAATVYEKPLYDVLFVKLDSTEEGRIPTTIRQNLLKAAYDNTMCKVVRAPMNKKEDVQKVITWKVFSDHVRLGVKVCSTLHTYEGIRKGDIAAVKAFLEIKRCREQRLRNSNTQLLTSTLLRKIVSVSNGNKQEEASVAAGAAAPQPRAPSVAPSPPPHVVVVRNSAVADCLAVHAGTSPSSSCCSSDSTILSPGLAEWEIHQSSNRTSRRVSVPPTYYTDETSLARNKTTAHTPTSDSRRPTSSPESAIGDEGLCQGETAVPGQVAVDAMAELVTENNLTVEAQRLKDKVAELVRLEGIANGRVTELEEREAAFATRVATWEASCRDVLIEKEKELNRREREMEAMDASMTQREASLELREDAASAREARLLRLESGRHGLTQKRGWRPTPTVDEDSPTASVNEP